MHQRLQTATPHPREIHKQNGAWTQRLDEKPLASEVQVCNTAVGILALLRKPDDPSNCFINVAVKRITLRPKVFE